jgi:hypothetical protein
MDRLASAGDFVEIVAQRLFKGSLESRRIRVHVARELSREDREEVSAWFLVRRPDGSYEETAPASMMAEYYFMDIAARTERMPFPGMTPRKVAEGIVLDLGVDSGLGSVSKAPVKATRSDRAMLVGQITNFGAVRRVMSPSESSELDKGNPRIYLEILDSAGRDARRLGRKVFCGNLSDLGEFVDLRHRETLKFMVQFHYDSLPAGTYTARLYYEVRRNIEGLNVDGSFRPPSRATLTRAKTLWEGTVVSDWITFRVVDPPRDGG